MDDRSSLVVNPPPSNPRTAHAQGSKGKPPSRQTYPASVEQDQEAEHSGRNHRVAQSRPRLGRSAFSAGNYRHLDLPTLIYATRNWNIHRVLLSSSFRGTRKKFNVWIDTVNIALARILEGAVVALQKAI